MVTIRRLERIRTTSQALMQNAWNGEKNVILAVDGGKGLERKRDCYTLKKRGRGDKTAGLHSNISMIILKVNGFKTPFKGQRSRHKTQPYPRYVQEATSITAQNVENKGYL